MEREDVFVRTEDKGPDEESATAVGEPAVTHVKSQESQNSCSHIENYFVLTLRDMRNVKILYFDGIMFPARGDCHHGTSDTTCSCMSRGNTQHMPSN